VDFDPGSLINPSWPPEAQELRATLWPVVNFLLPIRLQPAAEGEADYFALKPQLLPRVPVPGEWLEVPRGRALVDRVQWTSDGRVGVHLQEAAMDASYLDELGQAGWKTFPRQDADDWLKRLVAD
jgi:hypothetical protein